MENVEDLLPTTPAQSGMLFESLARPDACVNIGVVTARLPANLDLDRYKSAWAATVARHQSLRCHFLWEGLSAPVLVIREEVSVHWEELDWRQLDQSARDAVVEDWRRTGLVLDQAPVLRLGLVRLNDGWMLIWACHHALLDDWSMDLVLGEVEAAYDGQTLPTAMPFRDYADWLAARDDAHWGACVAGLDGPTRMAFRADSGNQPTDPVHVSEVVTLSREDSDALAKMAQDLRVTLASVLTAIWGLVVNRMSDTQEAVFGIATTQRSADLPGSQSAVGNFVATLPIRCRANPDTSLRAYITARASEALTERDQAPPSLSELAESAGLDAATPLFDTILSIKETGLSGYSHHMHRDQVVRYHSSFPLAMIMRPGAQISLTALANPARLDANARAEILRMTQMALQSAPAMLDQPCTALTMTDPGAAVLSGAPLPPDPPLLPGLIAQQTGPAITDAQETLDYSALDQRASALAAQLTASGAGTGDRVGVLMPRGATAVAAFLAAWRIGAAYVPLDPAQSDARLHDMVAAADLCCILTDPSLINRMPGAIAADPRYAGQAPRHTTLPSDTAYVMFTSGSTGTPKGVVISHGNLAASNAARPLWYADQPDRFMVVSPFGFDSSVAGMYWTLAQGGTLVVPTADEVQDPRALCALIRREGVTHTLCLPSLYDLILSAAQPGDLDTLRCTIVAGEACAPALIQRHHTMRPDARLVNEYGPTEATVWCAAAELTPRSGPVPIGGPIPGVSLDLRDALDRPVPNGLPGLLHVSGPGVTSGYFNAPEMTAKVLQTYADHRRYATGDLVRRLPDGQLEFLGRQDDQVKVRGHRIELGDVETRLMTLPDVTAAAVAAVQKAGQTALVAYVTGPTDQARTLAEMRALLPGAYCPAHLVILAELPRTATGKINRPDLVARGVPAGTGPVHAPETETEERLAVIWQDLLETPTPPDVEADFFGLGGDSLLAMRLVGEVAEAFDHPLRVADMMRAGLSIRQMAQLLEQGRSGPPIVQSGWPAPANASQKAMWLAARMNPGQPFFNLTLAAAVPVHLDRDALCRARDALAQRHDSLRCRFQLENRTLSLTPDAPEAQVTLSQLEDEGAIDTVLHEAAAVPFDMADGALWRINAWHVGRDKTVVQLMLHHTISDGSSLDIAMQDLVTLLGDQTPTTHPPSASFSEALALDHSTSDESRAYWDQTLSDLSSDLAEIAPDFELPSRAGSHGHLLEYRLPATVSQDLKALAARLETSVFVLLWVGLGQTLYGLNGVSDSIVAVSHSNRPARGFDRTVGCFTKALPYPLRTDPSDIRSTVLRARDMARNAMAFDDIAVEALDLPRRPRSPAYLSSFAQTALQYNDFDWTKGISTNATALPFQPTTTSVFEVSLAWSWRGDELVCHALARADLFERTSVDAWLSAYADHLKTLIAAHSDS